MGKNFRETLHEQMKDPAFRAEWKAVNAETLLKSASEEAEDLEAFASAMAAHRENPVTYSHDEVAQMLHFDE